MDTLKGVPVEQAIHDWLSRLTLDKSPATIRGYRWELTRLAERYPGRALEAFTAQELVNFMAERRASGAGDATVKRTTLAVRSFFRYYFGKDDSPARALPIKRRVTPVRKPRSLSAEAASGLLASLNTATVTGLRDLALVSLMLDSGLRAAEVCRLNVADVDWATRHFKVVVKGGDLKAGKFSPPTGDYLGFWLDTRRQLLADLPRRPGQRDPLQEPALFVGVGGKTRGRRMTTGGLRSVFRKLGRAAGLEALSPHDLRRSFAHLALRAGVPTKVLKEAGRWQDLDTVEVYSREIGVDDFDPYSPVARLMAMPAQRSP